MYNEVENFFPPTDLCFGLDENSAFGDKMENYNRKIDEIRLFPDELNNKQ